MTAPPQTEACRWRGLRGGRNEARGTGEEEESEEGEWAEYHAHAQVAQRARGAASLHAPSHKLRPASLPHGKRGSDPSKAKAGAALHPPAMADCSFNRNSFGSPPLCPALLLPPPPLPPALTAVAPPGAPPVVAAAEVVAVVGAGTWALAAAAAMAVSARRTASEERTSWSKAEMT